MTNDVTTCNFDAVFIGNYLGLYKIVKTLDTVWKAAEERNYIWAPLECIIKRRCL